MISFEANRHRPHRSSPNKKAARKFPLAARRAVEEKSAKSEASRSWRFSPANVLYLNKKRFYSTVLFFFFSPVALRLHLSMDLLCAKVGYPKDNRCKYTPSRWDKKQI
jgi:hypothetical protein